MKQNRWKQTISVLLSTVMAAAVFYGVGQAVYAVFGLGQVAYQLLDLLELEIGVVQVGAGERQAVGRAAGLCLLRGDVGQLHAHHGAVAQRDAVVDGHGGGALRGAAAGGYLRQAHRGVCLGEGVVYLRLQPLRAVHQAHDLAHEYVALAVHQLIAGLRQRVRVFGRRQRALCRRCLRHSASASFLLCRGPQPWPW